MFSQENLEPHNDRNQLQCTFCDKNFNIASELSIHQKIHNVEIVTVQMEVFDDQPEIHDSHDQGVQVSKTVFQCPCLRKFELERDLLAHLQKYINEEPFECQLCDKQFHDKSELTIHRRLHSKQNIEALIQHRSATKALSQKITTSSSKLPSKTRFECDFCVKTFARKSDVSRHVKAIHFGGKLFKCNLCGKTFSDKSKVNMHKKRMHVGDKQFKCLLCGKYFLRQIYLKNHLKSHSAKILIRKKRIGEKPVKFQYGDKPVIRKCTALEKQNLGIRAKVSVLTKSQQGTPRPRFGCQFCLTTFSRISDAIRHERAIHFGEKPFKCCFCEKSYTDRYHLTVHENNCQNDKNKKCQFCYKTFAGTNQVIEHVASIHPEAKILIRNPNTRQKSGKAQLVETPVVTQSISSHCNPPTELITKSTESQEVTPRTRHECQFCDRSFLSQSYTRRHEKITHFGKNPFKCRFCDKGFTNKHKLNLHETNCDGTQVIEKPQEVTNKPRYPCQFCEKTFAWQSAATRHEKALHFGTKPFECIPQGEC